MDNLVLSILGGMLGGMAGGWVGFKIAWWLWRNDNE